MGCEGGDFLDGDLRRLEEARGCGRRGRGLIGAWPAGLTSRSLADFGTEIIRLAEVVGPGHVAIGTNLDGNYRPVLTSYDQLPDLAALLRDHGLPATRIQQVLGRNAADLLHRIWP